MRSMKSIICPHMNYCTNSGIGCGNCKWNRNIQLKDNLRFGNGKRIKMLGNT